MQDICGMLGVSDFFRPKGEDNPELQVDKSNEAPHDFSSHLSKRTFDFCFDNSKGQIQTLGLIEHDTPYVDLTNESNQGLRRDGKSRFQIETDELQKVRQSKIKLRQSHKAQKGEINSLNQSLKQNERDLQDVRTKLANTQEELTLCKDDLFRLQPAAQVPDTDILKDFDQLCENIVSWIDDELLSFENASPNAQTNQIFSDGGSIHVAHLLHEYPNIGEYLVRHEVHHRLQNSILDPDTYLLGLSDGTVTVLKEVERSMLHSTPPRDFASVLNWRSETLNALASSEAYVQARERVLLEMTSNAFDAISQVFPIIKVSRDSRVRFNEEVAIPAATLMSKIQLSASYYSIRIPLNPLLRYYHVNSEHLSTARFMDLGTRRLLKPGSAVDAESNGDIGHVIIPLEPHLSRENEGKKGTILRQEMLLLQLNRPLKKRHQAFRLRMEN